MTRKNPVFMRGLAFRKRLNRNNDLEECLPILEKFMPKSDFDKLTIVEAPQYFLDVVASSKVEEF